MNTNKIMMSLSYIAPVAVTVNPAAGTVLRELQENEKTTAFRMHKESHGNPVRFSPAHV